MFKPQERQSSSTTYMSNSQKADYLKDLRSARPGGSRPAPPSRYNHDSVKGAAVAPGISTFESRPEIQQSCSAPILPTQQDNRRWSKNVSSTSRGQALVQPPADSDTRPDLEKKASFTYLENGTRWMEKQEVKSLRQALSDMDLAEEQRIYKAAQDEASELVWKHKNTDTVYRNPDARKDYMSHLRKGSYQRSNEDTVPVIASRSSSGSSSDGQFQSSGRKRLSLTGRKVSPTSSIDTKSTSDTRKASASKSYGELADMVRKDIAESRRRTSSGSRRMMSGEKKYFMHPDDKIWEDAEESPRPLSAIPNLKPTMPASVPAYTRKNPFARVRMQQDRLERSNSAPLLGQQPVPSLKHERIEIQRNAPSQSRNPEYTASQDRQPQQSGTEGLNVVRERRDDDIRAATSKLRRDRSPKLPQPTLVSDKPGRPIVSFQEQKEIVLQQFAPTKFGSHDDHVRHPSTAPLSRDSQGSPPSSSATTIVKPFSHVSIPTISLPDEHEQPRPIPSIVLPDDDEQQCVVPSIGLPDDPSIPSISIEAPGSTVEPAQRPLPRRIPHKSTPHYSPSARQSSVLCAHCALPIAGRILSAAGERFHPGCFVCHRCDCNLELVAFYPEPEARRAERVQRIRARQAGQFLDGEEADGDESLRFYCHLDFHETFSPRCKSCKTPIEGEIVVACGAEWHAGHFFCAQCGDPFDSTTPFVEKDGYAWCVGCYTNRFSSKCRKCKKPVIDVVVKALGADWHNECFRCMECNRNFDDGRYFLRDDSLPVCVRCEEIRLKA